MYHPDLSGDISHLDATGITLKQDAAMDACVSRWDERPRIEGLVPRRASLTRLPELPTVWKGERPMLKLAIRILTLAALGSAVAAPRPSHAAPADNHVAHRNWSHAYVLTPLEHKRL